jgi:DNA-binding NtrC family response regulator
MLLSPAEEELRERHVVVSIDDEPGVLAALRRMLRYEPYEFLTTQAPEEAIRWVLDKHASLFLADQRMPHVTGLELLELVMKCSPSTIRVMLTGQSDLSGVLKVKKTSHRATHPETVGCRGVQARPGELLLRKRA